MIIYNIDKLDEDVNCPISYVNDIYVNYEKIKYILKYVCKIYDVKSIEVYSDYIKYRITTSDWFEYYTISFNNIEIIDNYLYIVESINDGIVLDRLLKIMKLNDNLQY